MGVGGGGGGGEEQRKAGVQFKYNTHIFGS